MQFPIDRRRAVGLAGAALAYGLGPGDVARARSRTDDGDAAGVGLKDRPSVRDKGAKGDGMTMDGAAVQDALRSFDTLWVPPGVYMIDVPLVIPSYCVLAFSSQAIFCPVHDGMTVFSTGEVSYASRLLAPRVHARGKRGITAFDLRGFRHRAEIQHADIHQCAQGIILRELCWDTMIYMPWIRETTNPMLITNGSNAVDVIHPAIDDCDVGIAIEPGRTNATTTVRISGGYVQNGRCGIVDRGAIGTIIDGTYFEGLRDADIALLAAIRPNVSRTQHYGNTGKVAIQGVGVDGLTVFDPLMSSGTRTVGLYDFDASSRNITRFEATTTVGTNQPLGNVGRSQILAREEGGAFTPALVRPGGSVTYTQRQGRWRRSGSQISVAVELCWNGAVADGDLIVSGVPGPFASPPVGAPPSAMVQRGNGWEQALVRLGIDGTLRFITIVEGRETPLRMTGSGQAAASIHYLV